MPRTACPRCATPLIPAYGGITAATAACACQWLCLPCLRRHRAMHTPCPTPVPIAPTLPAIGSYLHATLHTCTRYRTPPPLLPSAPAHHTRTRTRRACRMPPPARLFTCACDEWSVFEPDLCTYGTAAWLPHASARACLTYLALVCHTDGPPAPHIWSPRPFPTHTSHLRTRTHRTHTTAHDPTPPPDSPTAHAAPHTHHAMTFDTRRAAGHYLSHAHYLRYSMHLRHFPASPIPTLFCAFPVRSRALRNTHLPHTLCAHHTTLYRYFLPGLATPLHALLHFPHTPRARHTFLYRATTTPHLTPFHRLRTRCRTAFGGGSPTALPHTTPAATFAYGQWVHSAGSDNMKASVVMTVFHLLFNPVPVTIIMPLYSMKGYIMIRRPTLRPVPHPPHCPHLSAPTPHSPTGWEEVVNGHGGGWAGGGGRWSTLPHPTWMVVWCVSC